ncbi:CHAT domain-containing tetratricopeptide repeat protein, partial [Zavarzinella formosa]|uniref:CHAT domain-containing tetratricopeptide repeat protein n=1 Tax=Zavarzinella formosa TaxID=360055 RepID=UPI000495C2CD
MARTQTTHPFPIMTAPVLVIRHVPDTNPPKFTVSRLSDGNTSDAVLVAPPNSVRVEGRPNDDLIHQLRWYLEKFLDYPFHPDDEYAGRVQAALREWGRRTFDTLFGSGKARDFYHDATRGGLQNLTVRVVSDSPFILGWPWEALEDAATARLAHQCEIERRIEKQGDPSVLVKLPDDCLNVLLVIARPYKGDVKYRSISRSLVELAADHAFPISVHVLRPPTFAELREHLRKHPHHYHILHFDGHGAYRADAPAPGGGNVLRAADGRLLFETDNGDENPVDAEQLSELLREHAVPVVVLNACQSAMIDDKATDPFASVAAALLKSGTRSVVAMAYALYVSGAKQFLPGFYRRLFESGNLAAAVRAGRQQMLENKGRVCARGTYDLDDWLVPVVYQQDPLDFSFVAKGGGKPPGKTASRLPEAARDDRNPYGFVGRDGALLALERAMHRPAAGILVTGLGGVGKTTLARGFLRWLEQTGGLGAGALWFDFREVRSAEYVLNRIGEALTGKPEFATHKVEEKLAFLADACRGNPVRIVWDNFESARGIDGTAMTGNLSDDDAKLLKEFLTRLRGGRTKVLITSRSAEEWLGITNIGKPVSLGGLDGEERWEFANAVLGDFDLRQNLAKPNPHVKELVEMLKGHPLAMRVMLPKLANRPAAQLIADLETNLAKQTLASKDESEAALAATLRFATESLPTDWQPLLILIGLHEGYAVAGHLEMMAKQVEGGPTRGMIDECLTALGNAGLVRDIGQAIYELHPLLTSYLRGAHELLAPETRDSWTRAFVDFMAGYADHLAPKNLHEQRFPFLIHEANFHTARAVAERLDMTAHFAALTQALAVYAQNTRNYPAAVTLFDQLQMYYVRIGDEKGRASPLHQLGRVAQERRDFAAAESWYRKSLEISERQGNEHGAAITYHQLGLVAEERRDFAAAESWYRKSLEIKERQGNEHGAAITYHQLGLVAEERRDFAAAESWYRKSLEIEERQGNEHGAAITYHQLGRVAEERRDFAAAESWYRKSLEIEERQGNEHEAASTYHQLGI